MKIQHVKKNEMGGEPSKSRVDAESGDALDRAGIKWMTVVIEDTNAQSSGITRQYTVFIEAEASNNRDGTHPVAGFSSDDDVLVEAIVNRYLNDQARKK